MTELPPEHSINVDAKHRIITLTWKKNQFAIEEEKINITFAVWKSVAGHILMAEAQAEEGRKKENGKQP